MGMGNTLQAAGTAINDSDRASILIVDDRPDKLLVFRTILEELGQNIISLQSGEEALRWLLEDPVVLPIPGAKDAAQARTNAGALAFSLPEDERRALTAASDRATSR